MKLANIVLATLLSISTAAFAHPEHEEAPPPQQTLKLHSTKQKSGVIIHVTDEGVKFPTAGASGKLVWTKGTKNGEAMLESVGENSMQAKNATPPAGSKMQASITFADKTVFTGDVHAK